MLKWKSVAVLILLTAGHLMLPSEGMIFLYGGIGVLLALSGTLLPALAYGRQRGILLIVPVLELLIGLAFRLFAWDGRPLQALSVNFGLQPWKLMSFVIGVNMLTGFLLSFTCFYLTRILIQLRISHK